MTSKERMLAAVRCHEVDYVPLNWGFWFHPRHPRICWETERERLAVYRDWEWDTSVGFGTYVSHSPDVQIEVEYEQDGKVLHQTWHTPAGDLSERLKVTDDWEEAKNVTTYLPLGGGDFRAPRYLEAMVKSADDLPKLEYLFPKESPADADAMMRAHRGARALADEFQVPVYLGHPAGMDYLTWMFSADGAVMAAMDNLPMIEGVMKIVNDAYAQRLEIGLELGVDVVERRGWYESTDYWSPSFFATLAKPILERELDATHRAGAAHVYLMDSGIEPLIPQLDALPLDCLYGLDPVYGGIHQETIRARLPGKSIWAGLSGPEHLGRGTPESVEHAVEKAFADFGKTGFILGIAVGIRHDWPAENLEAAERAWRRLRA